MTHSTQPTHPSKTHHTPVALHYPVSMSQIQGRVPGQPPALQACAFPQRTQTVFNVSVDMVY